LPERETVAGGDQRERWVGSGLLLAEKQLGVGSMERNVELWIMFH